MGAYVCGWTRKQACVAEKRTLTTGLSEGTFRNLLCQLLGFDSEAKGPVPLHAHTDSEAARCIALKAGVIPKRHQGTSFDSRGDASSTGRVLAGVAIASLTTSAEGVSEVTSTLVQSIGESCLAL
eukprot:53506-Amphidinium_carterae.1